MIQAPWTPEQVDALNHYQNEGWMHPFTCPNGHGNLLAIKSGCVCYECDYTQHWAHDFMFTENPQQFPLP